MDVRSLSSQISTNLIKYQEISTKPQTQINCLQLKSVESCWIASNRTIFTSWKGARLLWGWHHPRPAAQELAIFDHSEAEKSFRKHPWNRQMTYQTCNLKTDIEVNCFEKEQRVITAIDSWPLRRLVPAKAKGSAPVQHKSIVWHERLTDCLAWYFLCAMEPAYLRSTQFQDGNQTQKVVQDPKTMRQWWYWRRVLISLYHLRALHGWYFETRCTNNTETFAVSICLHNMGKAAKQYGSL